MNVLVSRAAGAPARPARLVHLVTRRGITPALLTIDGDAVTMPGLSPLDAARLVDLVAASGGTVMAGDVGSTLPPADVVLVLEDHAAAIRMILDAPGTTGAGPSAPPPVDVPASEAQDAPVDGAPAPAEARRGPGRPRKGAPDEAAGV